MLKEPVIQNKKKSQNGRDVLIALEVKIQTAVRQFRSRGTDIYE